MSFAKKSVIFSMSAIRILDKKNIAAMKNIKILILNEIHKKKINKK